jgi:hypothetical protein
VEDEDEEEEEEEAEDRGRRWKEVLSIFPEVE